MSHGYDFDIPLLHMVLFLPLACIALYESAALPPRLTSVVSRHARLSKPFAFCMISPEPIAIRRLITAFGCFGKHFAEFSV